MVIMKRLIYVLLAVLAIAGCKKPEPGPGPDVPPDPPVAEKTLADLIAGEWHCTPSDIDADIYISFVSDGTFELYQQITEGAHRLYRGKWTLSDTTLKGTYNDGDSWGSDYSVSMSEDTNTMTLSASSLDYIYKRSEIPGEVKEKAVISY